VYSQVKGDDYSRLKCTLVVPAISLKQQWSEAIKNNVSEAKKELKYDRLC
jgi:hypothetical protein